MVSGCEATAGQCAALRGIVQALLGTHSRGITGVAFTPEAKDHCENIKKTARTENDNAC